MNIIQNLDLLSIGVAVITIGVLGLVVFLNNRKSITNQTFFAFSLITIFWAVANYLHYRVLSVDVAFWLIRIVIFIAVWHAFTFFQLFYSFPKRQVYFPKLYKFFLIPLVILISFINLTPFVFKEVAEISASGRIEKITNGPGIALFGILISILIFSAILLLIKKTINAKGDERAQFGIVLIGAILTFILIITFNFVLPAFLDNPNFIPLSGIFLLPFIALTSYAIVKHRLFDIRIFVLRAVSFLLTSAVLVGAYAFILLALIKKVLGLQFDTTVSAVSVVMALLILITFRPLDKFFRWLTNRIFHASRYNPDELLAQLNEAVKRTVDLERMTKETLDLLTKQIGLARASWLLVDNHKIVSQHSLGFDFSKSDMEELEGILHAVDKSQTITNYQLPHAYPCLPAGRRQAGITSTQAPIIFDNLEESPTKEILRKHDMAVMMPVMAEGAEIAILILGNKLSGESYFAPDHNLLNVFVSEAGFAIQNARLYENVKNLSESKSKFISVVSHQLRTPVSSLKWSLEGLTKKQIGDTDIKDTIRDAYKSSVFLGGQLDDIIVALDIYDRKLLVKKESCVLADIINDINKKDLAEIISVKRLNIKIDLEKDAQRVSADSEKLRKILLILIRNAAVYSKSDGEIKISSKLEDKSTADSQQPTTVVVRVADNGIGIDPEETKYIFDQFYRGEKARTTMPDGLGLGLFIVKSFIEAHGGDVWFYSAGRDKGTEFYVSLPAGEVGLPVSES